MQSIRIVDTDEQPITLEAYLQSTVCEESLAFADAAGNREFDIVVDIGTMVENLRQMRWFNNFTASRCPYEPLLGLLFQEVYSRYLPPTGNLSCLEIGPGPVAYAATHSLIPFDILSDFTMMESSRAYCDQIEITSRYHGWGLVNADVHTYTSMNGAENLIGAYDLVVILSAADSTAFPGLFLSGIHSLLKDRGRVIIFQDVWPCEGAILAIEYLERCKKEKLDDMVFGFNRLQENKLMTWIESEAPWLAEPGRVSVPEYLRGALLHYAGKVGFTVVNNTHIWSAEGTFPIPTSPGDRVSKLLNGHNALLRYFGDYPQDREGVPQGFYHAQYATDVIVLEKSRV